jgi:hypothetical protein
MHKQKILFIHSPKPLQIIMLSSDDVLSFWTLAYEKSRLCQFQLDKIIQKEFGGITAVAGIRSNLVWQGGDGQMRLFGTGNWNLL